MVNVTNEQDIIRLVEKDEWMLQILRHAKSLQLPDWWVCAGFVRSKVWDTLHGFTERTALADVDVIYFDPATADEQEEKLLEQKLKALDPTVPWSVKNEARMHLVNGIAPYESAVDAISKFPETATALGLSLDQDEQVLLAAPCGVEDLLSLQVKPTPYFAANAQRMSVYKQRVVQKNWKSKWHRVEVFYSSKQP